jgi:hypothetical protein
VILLGQRLRSLKKILALKVDTETPESFMLRQASPLVNENWTRWVKSQQCVCCNKQADDPTT